MDFLILQRAVANLHWDLNYYQFCRDILEKNQSNEQLENDLYCQKKWDNWQNFNKALHLFDRETLERIITLYELRKINK